MEGIPDIIYGEEEAKDKWDNPFSPSPELDGSNADMKATSYYANPMLHHFEQNSQSEQDAKKLQGTFVGVFLPCVQNIVGIILFVRLSWITGQAGIGEALLILYLCTGATTLTALSMSAVATNGKIPAGGSYYMIGRSLGPAVGGSVGILYYLGLTTAVAMYVLGAIETLINATGLEMIGFAFDIRFLSYILVLLLCAINYFGIKYVARLSVAVLAALIISLICMYIGIFVAGDRDDLPGGVTGLKGENFTNNFSSYYSQNTTFQILLPIFFPSVTGIMAGSNRSGDLRNPSYSIPRGTVLAIFSTTVMYTSFIFFFGGVSERSELVDNINFVSTIAWPSPHLVYIGILFCTTGAALQTLAGAPRVLTSIAQDDILPLSRFKEMNPALYLTTGIATLAISIGSLDLVTPIISMFYLLFYCLMNIACCLLGFLGNPSWRPTWPYYHWGTALAGSLLCITLMFVINWIAALSSLVLAVMLYYYIDIKTQAKNWGDGLTGLAQERAKRALLGVDPIKVMHVKNWKPQLLVLGYLNEDRMPRDLGLISLVEQLKKGKGLTIFGTCIVGQETKKNFEKLFETKEKLHLFFKQRRQEIFTKVVLNKTARRGLKNIIQTAGLGGLEPNTIVLSWPENWQTEPIRASRFCKLLEYASNCGYSILILNPVSHFDNPEKLFGPIDIWWFSYDGGLMCLLAYLLVKHKIWRRCPIRIFFVLTSGDDVFMSEMRVKIENWVRNYRIFTSFTVEVVVVPPESLAQHKRNINDIEKRRLAQMQAAERTRGIDILYEIEEAQIQASMNNYEEDRNKVRDELNQAGISRRSLQPDEGEIINSIILKESERSELVITVLPEKIQGQSNEDFLKFCGNMVAGLKRVMFVRGNEMSVVTDYTQFLLRGVGIKLQHVRGQGLVG